MESNRKKLTADDLDGIGFTPIPSFNIMNAMIYDLGRNRSIYIGSIGTPNEMVFICEMNPECKTEVTDLVCIRNYDYDGYTTIEVISGIVEALTRKV